MNKKITPQILIINNILFFALITSLSGCTTNQVTNENVNSFLGTWVGTTEIPMSGREGNASVSQITFTINTAKLTFNITQESFTMNYTYTINGNTLMLQPIFNERDAFPGGQPFNRTMPFNGTRPPRNGTWPQNGSIPNNETLPFNGTQPWENGTWLHNWTRPPSNQRLSPLISFTYRFNNIYTILYLNESQFTKLI